MTGPKKTMKTTSVSLRIPADLKEILEEQAAYEGRSLSNLIIRLLKTDLLTDPADPADQYDFTDKKLL